LLPSEFLKLLQKRQWTMDCDKWKFTSKALGLGVNLQSELFKEQD
jgi:hypothetical protein